MNREEYNIETQSRRSFIKHMAAASAITAATTMLPEVTFAKRAVTSTSGELTWKKSPCRFWRRDT